MLGTAWAFANSIYDTQYVRELSVQDRMSKTNSPFTREQCREFIEEYSRKRESYVALADALTTVLKVPAGELGLPAMVQARAKDVSSFAGKIQRPEKGYTDPLNEITDFCGARVITLTLDGVTRICDYIEKHFEIFWEDSEDKLDSLGSNTFGYLSTHYIVAFREGEFPAETVPPELIGLKAEIQVRTLLQHAWADIAHEFSYKSALNLPMAWRRELSRLAALLEEGDQAFDQLQHDLLKYASSYEYHYSKEEIADEIARNEVVLEVDPGNIAVAHKIAKLAMTQDNWQQAVDVLSGFEGAGTPAMLRDLGISMCKLHAKDADSKEYARGQQWLETALGKNPNDVDGWASLGGTWRTLELQSKGKDVHEYRENARECYRRAFEIDASDPYALQNFIEYEMVAISTGNVLPYLRPVILDSIDRCKAQASAGVNLPWAYLSLGAFHLFLGEPMTALRYYALGVDSSSAHFFVTSPLRSFDLLEECDTEILGMGWARSFLELANKAVFGDSAPDGTGTGIEGPVVIVAGDCSRRADGLFDELLAEAFSDFRGTVISGGTNTGIAASVGKLGSSNSGIHTIGYVPGNLSESRLDSGYSEHRETDGDEFSPLEPIRYWRDLYESGISVEQIRLVTFGGGELSTVECSLALALGASVGIIKSNSEPDKLLLEDSFWMAKGAAGEKNLHALPADAEAIRTFLTRKTTNE